MADQKPDWEASYDIMGKVLIKLGKYSKAKVALTKAVSETHCTATVCWIL